MPAWVRFSLGLAAALSAQPSHANTEATAPPVSEALLQANPGADAATLKTGRRVLTSRCATCHRLYPISMHTPAGWQLTVEQMARRSKLDATQKSALLAYLTSAHNHLAARSGSPPPSP